MIDILTGTAFDATERMHHREDEVALEFPSSASSRVRHLNALKAQNWKASGSPEPPIPYPVCDGIRSASGTSVIRTGVFPAEDMVYTMSIDVRGTAAGWKVIFGASFIATADGDRTSLQCSASNYMSSYLSCAMPNNLSAHAAFSAAGGVCELSMGNRGGDVFVAVNGVDAESSAKQYASWVTQDSATDICILNLDNRGTPAVSGGFVGILKSFAISRGGADVLSCVPVVAPNGKGALWDTVSQRLLEDYNAAGDVAPWYAT